MARGTSINGQKIPSENRTVIGVASALKSCRARRALYGNHVVFGLAGEPHVPKRRSVFVAGNHRGHGQKESAVAHCDRVAGVYAEHAGHHVGLYRAGRAASGK